MYIQTHPITLQDILDLEDGSFKEECLIRLIECGFIQKTKSWEKISMRDLDKIRPGVILKRIFDGHESIIHVTSDPYWSSWSEATSLQHIFVCKVKRFGHHEVQYVMNNIYEYSINNLFKGDVYIEQ